MKTIIAAFLAVAFLASTPAFAGDEKAEKDKSSKKDDKKKEEKKAEKPAGGGW